MVQMPDKKHPLIRGTRITGSLTLLSRVLGLLRDVATASIFGLRSGGVADALVIAFRIPNLFRRLFGEGALTASYLPVITESLENDRPAAWRLASTLFALLAVILSIITLSIEAVIGLALITGVDSARVELLLELTALMLPYMIFICLAAQIGATLHGLSHFTAPALVSSVLNVCWIIAAWGICPMFEGDPRAQAFVIGGAVLIGGAAQLAIQLPILYGYGFRFRPAIQESRPAIRKILSRMAPMLFGLAITQLNTLMDSLIAWIFSRPTVDGGEAIRWLPGAIRYPMEEGATAAIYYGERLYNFPLGVLGIAVATAIFPLLSRHAARGEIRKLGVDMTLGLRLVLFLGIPASAGLILLADPLARLFFERGQFSADDAMRTARMITIYSTSVWAYCAIPVIVRGFYALDDYVTPVRVAVGVLLVNMALNLTLIWPLAERGLATATAIAAAVQVIVLLLLFSRKKAALDWPAIGRTAARSVAASAAMFGAGYATLSLVSQWIGEGSAGWTIKTAQVVLPFAACLIVYFGVTKILGGRELSVLVKGRTDG